MENDGLMAGMKKRLLLLIGIFATGSVVAQDGDNKPVAEEVRRYTVEMIIFRYNENVSTGTEVFVPDAPPEADGDYAFGDDLETVRDPAPRPKPNIGNSRAYEIVALTDDQFTMLEAWGHLERLDVYDPIMHFGWTQPTLPDELTEPRPLSSFARPPVGLDGELKLYLGRYLHLVVDLALDAPATGSAGYGTANVDTNRQPTHYRIQEDRIFKSGDVRYFDHPKFGVLAKITRSGEGESGDDLEEFLGDPDLVGR